MLPSCLLSQMDREANTQSVIQTLRTAQLEAKSHGGSYAPVLSPIDRLVSGENPSLDTRAVQKAGFPVVVWTVNDPTIMAELIAKRVDGIISDRPDLLQEAISKARNRPDNRTEQA